MDANRPWTGEFPCDSALDMDEAASEILLENMRASRADNRNLVWVSYDGGESWSQDRVCSEQNQVAALVKGFREFVSHHSRCHEYPRGVMVRWQGRVMV